MAHDKYMKWILEAFYIRSARRMWLTDRGSEINHVWLFFFFLWFEFPEGGSDSFVSAELMKVQTISGVGK